MPLYALMIQCLIAFNLNKRLRLCKWYATVPHERRNKICVHFMDAVLERRTTGCNFVTLTNEALFASVDSTATYRAVYKRFSSLYFLVVQDEQDNELLAVNLLTLLVDALDLVFVDVKEIDIVTNFEVSHFVVDEVVLGGEIQETNLQVIKEAVKTQQLLVNKEVEENKSASLLKDLRNFINDTLY